MTDMKVYDWRFYDPRMEAVYITDADSQDSQRFSPACGICPDLSANARRAREIECMAYARHPQEFPKVTGEGTVLYLAKNVEGVAEDTVRALRLVMEDEAPDWVASVWAARAFEVEIPGHDYVSLATGIPLQAVVAISQILEE